MKRPLFVSVVAAALLALAGACAGGGSDLATPSPGPSATATPAPGQSSVPREVAGPLPLERAAPIDKDGVFLVDVLSGDRWWLHDWGGQWSPDGQYLLAARCCAGNGGLEVAKVPAGPTMRIYEGDVAGAAWSPDGRRIVFSTSGGRGPGGLFVINRDGTGIRQVSTSAGWQVTWPPGGERVAVESSGGLQLIDVDTGDTEEFPGVHASAWSEDGRRLALASGSGLSIYDPVTRERVKITSGPAFGAVHWSPDGSRIALPYGERVPLNFGPFAATPEAGVPPLVIFRVDTLGEPISLGAARFLAWAPDGGHVAYESEGCITGEWDIYVADADGGNLRRLTTTPDSFKEGPVWSLDGKSIAFATHDELTVIEVQSGETRLLAFAEDGSGFHLHDGSGSPDGRYLQLAVAFGHGVCD